VDGTWDVRRTGGLLPPLLGVRKHIAGSTGVTYVVHPAAAVPFDVVGNELRYRAPFVGVVDVLEADGEDGYRGRCTLFGRTVGTFRLSSRHET
jgi:hypothetical protein